MLHIPLASHGLSYIALRNQDVQEAEPCCVCVAMAKVVFWVDSLLPNWSVKKIRDKACDLVYGAAAACPRGTTWLVPGATYGRGCARRYREGIPARVRGKIWPRAIGNNLSITPQLWSIFLQVYAAPARWPLPSGSWSSAARHQRESCACSCAE